MKTDLFQSCGRRVFKGEPVGAALSPGWPRASPWSWWAGCQLVPPGLRMATSGVFTPSFCLPSFELVPMCQSLCECMA